ncbi:MAG TPA: ABC transporter substrate-binding protein, partial [Oceanipulchritudo sp.]|nr:ABC transporter substrate-binding protein [Oceanipulchritudo sp.]
MSGVRGVFPTLLPACLALFLSGCGGGEEGDERAAPETFIFARGADAQKLDPADVDDGESVNTMAQVFEGLLAFKPGTLEVEPRLAESWEISPDGLTYTFILREGIRFHDGTPLNAESARYSFDRQMDPAHPAHFPGASFQYWRNLFSDIERIETVGPMTLRFHLSEPNAGLLSAFASFPAWLVSPGAVERFGQDMAFNPVGTGPYRFVDWRPNEAVLFERNPDYWRTGAEAGFERLVLRSIPLNSSRMSELLAGNIHGLDGIQPSELSDLEGDARFRIHRASGMNVGYLAFSGLSERLGNVRLRETIAMAIDRESLVDLALDGYGQVAAYPAPTGFTGIPEDRGPLRYDPETARRRVGEHPEWTEQPLRLATFGQPRMYFPDPQRIASLIRNDLEAVGFQVEIINREFKSHLHTTRRGDFELALLGWIADTPDPDNFLGTFFHSEAAVVGSATNISFYRDAEMDALLDAAISTTEEAGRAALYERVLDLWAKDLPLVPLVQADQITVLDARIGGYVLSPSGNHFFGPVAWEPAGSAVQTDDE